METISFKLDDTLKQEMEQVMHLYATKTEFIREAIRDKIQHQKTLLARQIVLQNFKQLNGKRPSRKERAEIVEQFFTEIGKIDYQQ